MLAADTGSVEDSTFKLFIAEGIAKGTNRPDGRAGRQDVRIPKTVFEEGCGGGVLRSLMYTDDRGTCVSCDVKGVFGPPPLTSRLEGRLNVHATAPLLRRPGADRSSGGAEMLRSADVVNGAQEDLGLRQIEGFVACILRRCVDLRQLCVVEGEACWVLSVHITLLNVDGGLFGCSLTAAVSALMNLALPRSLLPNGEVASARVLRFTNVPLACTYGVLNHPTAGPLWLADLNAGEELTVDSTLTLTLSEDGSIMDLRQLGSLMGLEVEMVKHWSSTHKKIRKDLGW